MDFFVEQDKARKKTRWLLVLYLLCMVGVVLLLNGVMFVGLKIALGANNELPRSVGGDWAFFKGLAIPVSVGLSLVMILSSLFKSMQLRAGGKIVAQDMGARLVSTQTTDHQEKRLLNVVEEMAIASGVPCPQVYLMDEESGINAFAAGTDPSNAVIGMTKGALLRLSREELQGVVAHEFSHILNGDMKLNMRLIGYVFGLVAITMLGRVLMESMRYSRGGRNRDGGNVMLAIFVVGILVWLVGSAGALFARILQAAISRQREFLADASAVQFTRNTDGIAGALKKIGGMSSHLSHPKAVEAGHLFFSDGGMFSFGLATHPPLDLRIRSLEKSWDGKFDKSELPNIEVRHEESSRRWGGAAVSSLAGGDHGRKVDHYEERVGESEEYQVDHGQAIYSALSEELIAAVHDKEKAQALVYGLLLAQDHQLSEGELLFLRKTVGYGAAQMAVLWQEQLEGVHSAEKIALVDLSLAALRGLSYEEYRRFIDVTQWLIQSDRDVDLFEYMLQRVVDRHLSYHFERRGYPPMKFKRLRQLEDEVHFIVSTVASIGGGAAAYQAAMGEVAGWQRPYIPIEKIDLYSLGRALNQFEKSTPLLKKQLIQMCALSAAHDGVLSNEECELLRVVGDSIGCSIPPILSDLEKVA